MHVWGGLCVGITEAVLDRTRGFRKTAEVFVGLKERVAQWINFASAAITPRENAFCGALTPVIYQSCNLIIRLYDIYTALIRISETLVPSARLRYHTISQTEDHKVSVEGRGER